MEATKAAGTSGEPRKENKMGVMPIPKLLLTMSLPMIISMIVQALYNVVDSIFVSQINENALTAVSLAFPIQNLMIAVASGTGVGVNALLSRSLGEKNYDQADKAANNSILLALIGFAVFCLFGLFGSTHLFLTTQTDDPQIHRIRSAVYDGHLRTVDRHFHADHDGTAASGDRHDILYDADAGTRRNFEYHF